MPESLVARPDVGAAHAAQRNQLSYPNYISGVQNNFGVKKIPVYIYNLSRLEFNTPRPPNHPHMLLMACKEGEEYRLVGTISHPFDEVDYDQNNNQKVVMTDGYIEATRMLNPMNHGAPNFDKYPDPQDAIVELQNMNDIHALSEGDNLNMYGCFWSVNNPPLPKEIAAARKRMESTYRQKLESMAKIEAKDPAEARDRADNIAHAAADYFGKSFSWHRSDLIPKGGEVAKIDCGACGEKIQPTARLCKECGAPTDPEKLEKWLTDKFDKRGPGRPVGS